MNENEWRPSVAAEQIIFWHRWAFLQGFIEVQKHINSRRALLPRPPFFTDELSRAQRMNNLLIDLCLSAAMENRPLWRQPDL